MLWVSDKTNAQVVILNTSDDTVDETVSTSLNPLKVVFCGTADDSSSDDNGSDGSTTDGPTMSDNSENDDEDSSFINNHAW